MIASYAMLNCIRLGRFDLRAIGTQASVSIHHELDARITHIVDVVVRCDCDAIAIVNDVTFGAIAFARLLILQEGPNDRRFASTLFLDALEGSELANLLGLDLVRHNLAVDFRAKDLSEFRERVKDLSGHAIHLCVRSRFVSTSLLVQLSSR